MKLRVTVVLMALALVACAVGTTSGGYQEEGMYVASPTFSANVACVGLACRQAACEGDAKTRMGAIVYDPAGKTPLYDVIVYVPNAPVERIADGASCERCGQALSGKPLVTALTDTRGHFMLEDLPVGDDIPLVIQIGKWRRQITLPHVEACKTRELDDRDLFRLPRSHAEGDMPRIALSTGCDPMECLLRKIGIDDSEFTDADGKGHVHIYRGNGGGGLGTSTSAYDFWSSAESLKRYDVVINACECQPFDRGPTAYSAMEEYLDMGGRFFGSHFHYNWFTDRPNESSEAVNWTPGGACNEGPNLVDDSFPKGKAMAEWLVTTGATADYGTIPLSCAPLDVAGTKNKLAQGWIYDGPTKAPSYVSFNMPIDAARTGPDAAQCGRAVFADLHVSQPNGDFGGQPFPSGCRSTELAPQEKALEFMFFDLASCVIDDSVAPAAPPAVK